MNWDLILWLTWNMSIHTRQRNLWLSAGVGPGPPVNSAKAFGLSELWDVLSCSFSCPWNRSTATSWGWAAAGLLYVSQAFIFGVSMQRHSIRRNTSKFFCCLFLFCFEVCLKFRIHKESPESIKSRGLLIHLLFLNISFSTWFLSDFGRAVRNRTRKLLSRVYTHFH